MKVAIICGAGIVSGKEIMALELGEGLRAAGDDVVYVTSKWGNGEFSRRLSELALPFYHMRLGFISATLDFNNLRMTADQLVRVPKLFYDYLRLLKREKPERVIHTNWHHALILWPFLRRNRDLFWLHEVVPDLPRYGRLFLALAQRIDSYVVISQAVGDALRRVGVPNDKIRLVSNGIRDPSDESDAQSANRDGAAIGIVGQVGAWKGHEDLLDAFILISGRHATARLHVFGANDRAFARKLVARAQEAGVGDRIEWHGFVEDRRQIYRQVAVCVIPSRIDEPFGLTALEPGFFGLPAIATRKGGLPEIIIDGETGLLVESESPSELAARLTQLLSSPELCRRLGSAARDRAVREFSSSRFIENFRRVLAFETRPRLHEEKA